MFEDVAGGEAIVSLVTPCNPATCRQFRGAAVDEVLRVRNAADAELTLVAFLAPKFATR